MSVEPALVQARTALKQQAQHIHRSLEQRHLRTALLHASTMLSELRNNSLSPSSYSHLFHEVIDELRQFEDFFLSEQQRGRPVLELYELVQHAGNLLPRLYLLCTVGAVFLGSMEAPARVILGDLGEMCRGVQHPVRGLFLRYYLLQVVKDKLPDVGSDVGGDGGSRPDSIDFILANFGEMTKLWVRMQHQGPIQDREKREMERTELKVLVGANLERLSTLEGMTLSLYSSHVLPPLLEQVINCKDGLAQAYLLECISQVFPIEYHVASLPLLLRHLDWLSPTADVNAILVNLMDKLASHMPAEDEPESASIFTPMMDYVAGLEALSTSGMLRLYVALAKLALTAYTSRLVYVESVYNACIARLSSTGSASEKRAAAQLRDLCMLPLDRHPNVLTALQLGAWPQLVGLLSAEDQKQVVGMMLAKVAQQGCVISEVARAEQLLAFSAPILRPPEGQAGAQVTHAPEEARGEINNDLIVEMSPFSSTIHSLKHPNTDTEARILNAAYKHATSASAPRAPFILVPLIFRFLQLAGRIKLAADGGAALEVTCGKLLTFMGRMVTALVPMSPTLALRLYLQCAQVADVCGEEAAAYEFFTQAFTVYEEAISQQPERRAAIMLSSATLAHTGGFSTDQYETLAQTAMQYSGTLLKKPDQARAICASSFAYWSNIGLRPYRNAQRVLESLQRALKVADAAKISNQHVPLFIEILETYLWHFDQGNELVTHSYIQSLLQLIDQHVAETPLGTQKPAHLIHYEHIRRHISAKKEGGVPKYQSLHL